MNRLQSERSAAAPKGIRLWIRDGEGRFLTVGGKPVTARILSDETAAEAAARGAGEQLGIEIAAAVRLTGSDSEEILLTRFDGTPNSESAQWASFEELNAGADERFAMFFRYMPRVPAAVCPMTMDDYDEVYALWCRMPGMGLNEIDDSREGIERYLKRNPTTCFLAKTAEGLVGTVLGGHDGRRGYLYHAAVDPKTQGMGVGRALTQTAMDALAREGVSKAGLMVFTANESGCRFWDRMGFSDRSDVRYRSIRLER